MKLFVIGIIFMLFLVGCAQEELPPSPPPPGGTLAGKAVGGIGIDPAKLPGWATPLEHTTINPKQVVKGDTIKVVVNKPSGVDTFYVNGMAYAFNQKFRFWEKVFADSSLSGKIVNEWVKDRGVFEIPVSGSRFSNGLNYIVIYWCIDTDERDDNGRIIWDCNSKKWGLGAFEFSTEQYPNILIENEIENNRYQSSEKELKSSGTAYIANYEDLNDVTSSVTVLRLINKNKFKEDLAKGLSVLEPSWTQIGNVCGFLEENNVFSWLSDSSWITATADADSVDTALIGVYGIQYTSDCDLLDDLVELARPVCRNGVKDGSEECDEEDDNACPSLCKPDCTCSQPEAANTGTCGDSFVQQPNSDGDDEECEPPGIRDAVTGQLMSTGCFVRSGTDIVADGGCDEDCECVSGPFLPLPATTTVPVVAPTATPTTVPIAPSATPEPSPRAMLGTPLIAVMPSPTPTTDPQVTAAPLVSVTAAQPFTPSYAWALDPTFDGFDFTCNWPSCGLCNTPGQRCIGQTQSTSTTTQGGLVFFQSVCIMKPPSLPSCGNFAVDAHEECGDSNLGCPPGHLCYDCRCILIPLQIDCPSFPTGQFIQTLPESTTNDFQLAWILIASFAILIITLTHITRRN